MSPRARRAIALDMRGLACSTITGTGAIRLTLSPEPGESIEAALARALVGRILPNLPKGGTK